MASTLHKTMCDPLVAIVGPDAVISDESELAVYKCDELTIKKLPAAVVLPAKTEDVAEVVVTTNLGCLLQI